MSVNAAPIARKSSGLTPEQVTELAQALINTKSDADDIAARLFGIDGLDLFGVNITPVLSEVIAELEEIAGIRRCIRCAYWYRISAQTVWGDACQCKF